MRRMLRAVERVRSVRASLSCGVVRESCVTLRIINPRLQRSGRPAAGASTKIYWSGKFAICDSPVKRGPAESGDAHHVANAIERRRNGRASRGCAIGEDGASVSE